MKFADMQFKPADVVMHRNRPDLGPGYIVELEHPDMCLVEWASGVVLRNKPEHLQPSNERALEVFEEVAAIIWQESEDAIEQDDARRIAARVVSYFYANATEAQP